jgi:hypothetical protein
VYSNEIMSFSFRFRSSSSACFFLRCCSGKLCVCVFISLCPHIWAFPFTMMMMMMAVVVFACFQKKEKFFHSLFIEHMMLTHFDEKVANCIFSHNTENWLSMGKKINFRSAAGLNVWYERKTNFHHYCCHFKNIFLLIRCTLLHMKVVLGGSF